MFIPKLIPYFAENKARAEKFYLKVDLAGGRSYQSAC